MHFCSLSTNVLLNGQDINRGDFVEDHKCVKSYRQQFKSKRRLGQTP